LQLTAAGEKVNPIQRRTFDDKYLITTLHLLRDEDTCGNPAENLSAL